MRCCLLVGKSQERGDQDAECGGHWVLLHNDQEPAQRHEEALAPQGQTDEIGDAMVESLWLTSWLCSIALQYDPIVRQHVIFNEAKIKKG
jgi:hypothetical protein